MMKKTIQALVLLLGSALMPQAMNAQSEIYPQHFNLEEVQLLDGPFQNALQVNNKLLLEYDVNRLLTPFVRQAGLSSKSGSKYYGWTTSHPTFTNWGDSGWSLEGHVGGHYLTALALAYAATNDAATRTAMKERLDYMLNILKDCQDAFNGNTEGMEGFLGGQPINQIWTGLYKRDLTEFKKYGGWVPFYCEHKVLAGLRDAWIYTGSTVARDLFRRMCDWSVNVVSNLTTSEMQDILGWEHGGMNEPLADAYLLFGEKKYLDAAKKYSHQYMIDGMQTLNTTFLDGKHANTQVPKYIGFERIYQLDPSMSTYRKAAHNFWTDVATHRTVCIGGNSISEHFLSKNRCDQYINNLEGPESCNTNNMLKLSELLFDETHDAAYADFYEAATWNHILSTQDPQTGGYVYFTSLRPQSYRIYSTVNKGMWCCVGTGMENHSKYGHFIYTHSTDNSVLYVNLFTASKLQSENFALTQQTQFPYESTSTITIDKDGDFTLAVRHPAWTTADFSVAVNGSPVDISATAGKASFVNIQRSWKKGDVVTVNVPMTIRVEACPNYTDYIAFKYGPILLAAQTTAVKAGDDSGLEYEKLQNEFAGEGRMDHSPGAVGKGLALSTAPLLIGERSKVLDQRVKVKDLSTLTFQLDAKSEQSKGNWDKLLLVPFYTIQHARYSCYFYQQTAEGYANSDMGKADAEEAALTERTIDFVATGEQQSEAGHQMTTSSNSTKGSHDGEFYRDCASGGYVQYILQNPDGLKDSLCIMCRFTTDDKGRVATIKVNGKKLADVTVPSTYAGADDNGFYNQEFVIPAEYMVKSNGEVRTQVIFRIEASGSTPIPGLYYLRLVKQRPVTDPYRFVSSEWVTGDGGRVAQSKISYDNENNTLTVKASGNNNVCLMLNYQNKTYNVTADQKYLIAKGTNLAITSGKNYLWWLNGVNRGSSVAPYYAGTADDGERVIAWDISTSGIADNCQGDIWNFCQGQTIFGMTSTTGTSVISYIGFQSSVEDFLASVGIDRINEDLNHNHIFQGIYDLSGRKLSVDNSGTITSHSTLHTPQFLPKGFYVVNGHKVMAK